MGGVTGNRIVDLSLKLNQIAVPRTNEDTVMSGRFHVLKGTGTNVKGLQTHLVTFSSFPFLLLSKLGKIKENVYYILCIYE